LSEPLTADKKYLLSLRTLNAHQFAQTGKQEHDLAFQVKRTKKHTLTAIGQSAVDAVSRQIIPSTRQLSTPQRTG